MAAQYCALCRRTSFAGRRHRYSAAHRRRLREALARLQEEVAAARAVAAAAVAAAGGGETVRPYDPAEHARRVWCLCCGRGVRRDGRRGGLALPRAGLLRHLAGSEHRRETARFWRENKAEEELRPRVLVPAEEYERFAGALEREVAAYQRREEERIRQMAAEIREAERRQRETVRAALQTEPEAGTGPSACSPHVAPERDSCQDTEQPGPSGMQTAPGSAWMDSGQALTFIGHQGAEGKGNVHTGARPPWLTEEEEEEEEEDGGKQPIGPSYEEFLRQKEKQKLKKLPAGRVGANFDHSSQTGEGWLPSFGRVWNHGRRWQSRHQFRTEAGGKKKN